jgi:predicted metal-dependent HD superfamily phosphohydrolase
MLQFEFQTQVLKITTDFSIIDRLWQEIQDHYTASGRYYHNLTHLDNVTTDLFNLKTQISDWQTLVFSIAYHDIVYDPLRQDNEEKSADLAVQRLGQLNLSADQQLKCKAQIIATKTHALSSDIDTNYFTDADLAVLGSEPAIYKQYVESIRNEYSVYPDNLYYSGRKKVLENFLAMPKIYKTVYFQENCENTARSNILNELQDIHLYTPANK